MLIKRCGTQWLSLFMYANLRFGELDNTWTRDKFISEVWIPILPSAFALQIKPSAFWQFSLKMSSFEEWDVTAAFSHLWHLRTPNIQIRCTMNWKQSWTIKTTQFTPALQQRYCFRFFHYTRTLIPNFLSLTFFLLVEINSTAKKFYSIAAKDNVCKFEPQWTWQNIDVLR